MKDTSEPSKKNGASSRKPTGSRTRQVQKILRRDVGPVARDAGRRIGKAWHATAKAAEKTTRIVGLRTKASARELRIRGLFLKIGESFYRTHKAGKSPEESAAYLRPLLDQVDKLYKEISSLKLQEKKIRSAK